MNYLDATILSDSPDELAPDGSEIRLLPRLQGGSLSHCTLPVGLTIPVRTRFQFRNTGETPLRFVIVTLPPWPGQDEAELLHTGRWLTTPTASR